MHGQKLQEIKVLPYNIPDHYQTAAFWITIVVKNGMAIQRVKKQTPNIIFEAVKNDDLAIVYSDIDAFNPK
ncbi:MAG: hypothetical protein R2879_20785 [Saprospiraceae bacterium]